MATITELTDIIKNGKYGRDVRKAIYDAIILCYEEMRVGNPDSITILAKLTTLNSRYNALVSAIAELKKTNEELAEDIAANSDVQFETKNIYSVLENHKKTINELISAIAKLENEVYGVVFINDCSESVGDISDNVYFYKLISENVVSKDDLIGAKLTVRNITEQLDKEIIIDESHILEGEGYFYVGEDFDTDYPKYYVCVVSGAIESEVFPNENLPLTNGIWMLYSDFEYESHQTNMHYAEKLIYGPSIKEQMANIIELPAVTEADNGKVLKVVNGVWTAVAE